MKLNDLFQLSDEEIKNAKIEFSTHIGESSNTIAKWLEQTDRKAEGTCSNCIYWGGTKKKWYENGQISFVFIRFDPKNNQDWLFVSAGKIIAAQKGKWSTIEILKKYKPYFGKLIVRNDKKQVSGCVFNLNTYLNNLTVKGELENLYQGDPENITLHTPTPLPSSDAKKGITMANIPLNQILYGPPGTGKTYNSVINAVAIIEGKSFDELKKENYEEMQKRFNGYKSDGRIEFVTFHQSYAYEEFVEGIKPKPKNDQITYSCEPGIFKKLCERSNRSDNFDKSYVLIIDEINRGNISKIFGELITLIETDKREKLYVTLPYSQESFTVPSNLYIIGTMNTSDRSIASIDIALRRRFTFIEMPPNPELVADDIEGFPLRRLMETLNKKISVLVDRDHQIGHAYFMKIKTIAELKDTWFNRILPLLNEYLYGDWHKLKLLVKSFILEEDIPNDLKDECFEENLYSFKCASDYKDENGNEAFIKALKECITPEKPKEQ